MTGSLISKLLPFVANMFDDPNSNRQITLMADEPRNTIYSISQSQTIKSFFLGESDLKFNSNSLITYESIIHAIKRVYT